jgi:periplasmic protein TonB
MALAASGAAHVVLGLSLSLVVWTSAPEEPAPAGISLMFEAPAERQAVAQSVPQTAAPEPLQPEEAQPEPAQPQQEAQAEPPPPEPTAVPVPEPAEVAPVVPTLEPAPEPVAPPPPVVQAVPSPPPPVPHTKPPTKQFAARPQAKPVPAQTGPATPSADPARSGPAPSADASPPQAESPLAVGWNSLFSAWLAARKTYPEAARRHGDQGNVTLRFTVAVDGKVLDVALVTGSGSPVLDQAAEALLQNAVLPAPHTEISRTVRLRYRLDD